MTKLEKINVFFGIIGLLADIAALVTFLFAFARISYSNKSPIFIDINITAIVLIIIPFVLLYGWFIISWAMARNTIRLSISRTPNIGIVKKDNTILDAIKGSVKGVGFFIAPIILAYCYIFSKYEVITSKQVDVALCTIFLFALIIFSFGFIVNFAVEALMTVVPFYNLPKPSSRTTKYTFK